MLVRVNPPWGATWYQYDFTGVKDAPGRLLCVDGVFSEKKESDSLPPPGYTTNMKGKKHSSHTPAATALVALGHTVAAGVRIECSLSTMWP